MYNQHCASKEYVMNAGFSFAMTFFIHYYLSISFISLFPSSSLLYSFSRCWSAFLSIYFRVVYEPNKRKVNTQCVFAAHTTQLYTHIIQNMILFIAKHFGSKLSCFCIKNFVIAINFHLKHPVFVSCLYSLNQAKYY